HWAFQPFREHPVPNAGGGAWIDAFLRAKLAAAKLTPAPPADRRTWIRRVTFDITGLPPSPREIDEFLADRYPRAHERVVDRLLASPHYGERWARHWLDLARYAETDGHEFDREKPNAWRYRDYVIRAFNQDLPFDQFVREHIAGDLLAAPRATPGGAQWDSPLATGFFGLGEERNAADDLAEVRAEKLDNQIDTLGKTFLGLTVACARCHDHKFDPISTRDYYALGGILDGKQVIQAWLDTPGHRATFERAAAELGALDLDLRTLRAARVISLAPGLASSLASAVALFAEGGSAPDLAITAWIDELKAAAREPEHVLYPLARLAQSKRPLPEELDALRRQFSAMARPRPGDLVLNPREFRVEGPAFFRGPDSLLGGALEFTGFLYSRTFRADRKYFHARIAGVTDNTSGRQPGQLRVSLVGDGRDAILTADPGGRFSWKTSGLGKMFDEMAYVEIADRSRSGYIAVSGLVLSDEKEPPRKPDPIVARLVENFQGATLAEFSAAYEPFVQQLAGSLAPVFDALPAPPNEYRQLHTELANEYRQRHAELARALPDAAYGMIAIDDGPRNLRLHIAGHHRNLGDEIPRGFLEVLSQGRAPATDRRALAAALADPRNPLTARVFLNRVWQLYFGAGLVRTSDNVGHTGEAPSHPE
ncbi:MAG: DUF1549 domain-containing protein, partial [Bryobacteraceae bacterium]